jgi:hypothetical protein
MNVTDVTFRAHLSNEFSEEELPNVTPTLVKDTSNFRVSVYSQSCFLELTSGVQIPELFL